MSFKNELVDDLEDLQATINENQKLVEDAFRNLEIQTQNFEVKRRGIVKSGANSILKLLQKREKASLYFISVH